MKFLNQFCLPVIILCALSFRLPAQDNRGVIVKSPDGKTGNRVALVIGNSAYQHTDALNNPVNDADDMTQELKDLGFEVISGTNQTKAQMQTLIRRFGNRLTDTKAAGLFFYAGHGIAQNGINYLIPIDADIQAEDEIEEASVSINFVLNKMEAAQNKLNMVILDACRNNPFARQWRNYRDYGEKGGLTRIDAPTGTLIAYATKPGEVASDGTDRNGLYTGALLRQMRVKNVEMGKMFQRVRADVVTQSKGKQVPFDESSVIGDFYFAGYEASNFDRYSNESENLKFGEAAFWKSIENSSDLRDFNEYIERSGNGEFSGYYNAAAKLKSFKIKKANALSVWAKLKPMARSLLKYDKCLWFIDNLAIVQIGDDETGKFGLVDRNGKEIVSPKYDEISDFSEEIARVRMGDDETGKYGFINKFGKEIVSSIYDYARPFEDGRSIVRIGDERTGKFGLIDKSGKEIIHPKYSHIEGFDDGLSVVYNGETKKYSIINRTGSEIITLNYDAVMNLTEGFARVRIGDEKSGKWGFINQFGEETVSPKYDLVYPFSQGLAVVRVGDERTGKFGFIDTAGNEIVPPRYMFADSFKEGLARIQKGNQESYKWGFVDETGKEIVSPKYDFVGDFSEGLSAVTISNKTGFIDKTGKEIISPKYDQTFEFSHGVAQVEIGQYPRRKKGMIDKTGREVVPPVYDKAELLSDQMIGIQTGNDKTGKFGVFDKKGKEIIPVKYDGVSLFIKDGIFALSISENKVDKIGFANISGELLTPIKYDVWCAALVSDGIFGVTLNGKKGFIDIYGNEFFDF